MAKKIEVKEAPAEVKAEARENMTTDTSKDVHWDANNRPLEEKEKDSKGAPDAGMTPEEADKKLGL